MKQLRLTWPFVALICFSMALVLGLLAWLIHDGKAQASVLLAPLSSFVVGASTYVVGLMKRPPWMDDVQITLGTLPPPSAPVPKVEIAPPPAWKGDPHDSQNTP